MTSTQALIPALQWRYATKQFDPTKRISDADVHELTESLRLSASSFGLQPWKFIVVNDPALRAKIKEHAWNQSQVTDASHLIVLAARKDIRDEYIRKFITATAEARGTTIEALKGYEDMMLGTVRNMPPEAITAWNQRQVYIALGTLLLGAAQKGIDACPMEGFDPKKVDEVLGMTEYTVTALCPVGYRAATDKYAGAAKVRFPASEIVEYR